MTSWFIYTWPLHISKLTKLIQRSIRYLAAASCCCYLCDWIANEIPSASSSCWELLVKTRAAVNHPLKTDCLLCIHRGQLYLYIFCWLDRCIKIKGLMAGEAIHIYTRVWSSLYICILCGLYKLFRSSVCVSTIVKSYWASSRALKRLPVSLSTATTAQLIAQHTCISRAAV
jgi:hypothetical protein